MTDKRTTEIHLFWGERCLIRQVAVRELRDMRRTDIARDPARNANVLRRSASCAVKTSEGVSRSRASAGARKKSRSATALAGKENQNPEVSNASEHAIECQRLREQLERVLVDRQRQEDEIMALRALAKSLKEEVEEIQRQNSRHTVNSNASASRLRTLSAPPHKGRPHEFFKLDVQVEELRIENASLREQLAVAKERFAQSKAFVDHQLPVYQLAAVKANAELQSVTSQLLEEQAQCDQLRRQVSRFKAQSDAPARVKRTEYINTASKRGERRDGENQLQREREELLRECLSEKAESESQDEERLGQDRHDKTMKAESSTTPMTSETLGASEPDKLLGGDLTALESMLRELHMSLGRSRCASDDDEPVRKDMQNKG